MKIVMDNTSEILITIWLLIIVAFLLGAYISLRRGNKEFLQSLKDWQQAKEKSEADSHT
jgi:hypothetical protein